jgi:hypothetical protein
MTNKDPQSTITDEGPAIHIIGLEHGQYAQHMESTGIHHILQNCENVDLLLFK